MRTRAIAVAVVAVTQTPAAIAGLRADAARQRAAIAVTSGQTLTEADLLAGVFNGQPFTLNAATSFDIYDGAFLGRVGATSELPVFDFGGAAANIHAGGRFTSGAQPNGSEVANLALKVHAGGFVDLGLIARSGTTVQALGGNIGTGLALYDSHLVVAGGRVERDLRAFDGSTVTITGGSVGDRFEAHSGASVVVDGGGVGNDFRLRSGSQARLAGGHIGRRFSVQAAGDLTIAGAEFAVNGQSVSSLSGGLKKNTIFTGTLADGSVFLFSSFGNRISPQIDSLPAGAVTLEPVAIAPPDTTPIVVTAGEGPTTGLRAGQHLTLQGTATLRADFAVAGGTLTIDGGSVGDRLEAAYAEINLRSGAIGADFDVFDGAVVNMTGGVIKDDLEAYSGATVNISGGTVRKWFWVHPGATVNLSGGAIAGPFRVTGSTLNISGGELGDDISATGGSQVTITGGVVGNTFRVFGDAVVNVAGGTIGSFFQIYHTGTVNISGGRIGYGFEAREGAAVHLFVTEAFIDGDRLDLVLGETMTITQRGGALLEATLLDGAALDLQLWGEFLTGRDFISPWATLTVTYIPAPGAAPLLAFAGLFAGRRRR